jgi:hypothetical protein
MNRWSLRDQSLLGQDFVNYVHNRSRLLLRLDNTSRAPAASAVDSISLSGSPASATWCARRPDQSSAVSRAAIDVLTANRRGHCRHRLRAVRC